MREYILLLIGIKDTKYGASERRKYKNDQINGEKH